MTTKRSPKQVTAAEALVAYAKACQTQSADSRLESQVAAQLREAERVKDRARKALPRAMAALKTCLAKPEQFLTDDERFDRMMGQAWKIS